MDRMFYLSIVYDANGYDRFDLTKRKRLQDLDEIVSNFRNKEEVYEAYLNGYNIDKKEGKLCIVYEDLETKRKELKEYNQTGLEIKDQISDKLTYAHIIPIMYKNKRLMNNEACLIALRHHLHNPVIVESIMQDKIVDVNGKKRRISKNKRYLFETENEQDLLYKYKKTKETIEEFLSRIKRAHPDTQYFYFRSLMDICNLSVNTKTVNNLSINDKAIIKSLKGKKIDETDKQEELEEDSKDMENFYLYHDLDEVIKFSPDSNRPIGSEGRKKR